MREALAQDLNDEAKRMLRVALAALARRDHSRDELDRKLRRAFRPGKAASTPEFTEERLDGNADADGESVRAIEICQVLDRLQARGLLSDQRMAQSLVRTRSPRYGRRRIQQELERRGVDRTTIAQSLPNSAEELQRARAIWNRKFGVLPQSGLERARQSRFLAARGFDASVIARVLSDRGEDALS